MKIICVGRNYVKHIEELKNNRPENPIIFIKPDSSILSKRVPFVIPSFSNEIHYEVEVLVKINKVGRHIQAKFAHKYYNHIGLGIDFTARDLQDNQKEKRLPWEISKGFDGSAAIGIFFPKTNFVDLENLSFQLYQNNKLVQDGNTQNMIWKIDEIISYISIFFTLKKGDVIFTGTPSGVGRVSPRDTLIGVLEEKQALYVRVR